MAGYHFDLPLGEYVEDLLAEAVAAEEVASAFFPFLSRTQEYSADISAVMSELLGISSAYRDLAKHLDSRAYYTRATLILDDLDLSLETMYFTLKPLEYHFERLGITPDPQTAAFARVWREIQSTLRNGSITFLETLRLFKDFLLGLADQLKGCVLPVQVDSPGVANLNIADYLNMTCARFATKSMRFSFDKGKIHRSVMPLGICPLDTQVLCLFLMDDISAKAFFAY